MARVGLHWVDIFFSNGVPISRCGVVGSELLGPMLVPFLGFVGQEGSDKRDFLLVTGYGVEGELFYHLVPPGSEWGCRLAVVGWRS